MNETIFISTQPGDEDARHGWRQPRSSFGRGLTPPSDEHRRFRAHPWYKETSRLTRHRLLRAVLMWFGFTALLGLYYAGSLAFLFSPSFVGRFVAVLAVGLYVTLMLALTVSGVRKAIDKNLAFERYLLNSTHEEAVARLRSYLTGQPYALYFRNFSLEAGIVNLPNNTELTYMLSPLGIEAKLASALEDELPLISLDNPANVRRLSKPVIPRLCVPPETWLDWLQDLIWAASLVLIYSDADSEGIRKELEMIHLLGQSDRTVVILPTSHETLTDLADIRLLASSLGALIPDYGPMTKDAKCLNGFQYVLYENEINFNELENTRGFCDILPEARRWGTEMRRRLGGPLRIFLNLIPVDTTNQGQFEGQQNLDPERFARRLKRSDRDYDSGSARTSNAR